MLEHLNKKHPTIQFELETPGEDGFLPILDIKVKIKADGTIERKLYTKEANKGITLHFNSHHSSSVKTTTVLNELARAERCSTPKHREEAISSTLAKMEDNGYSSSWLSKAVDRRKRPRKNKDPRVTSFSFRFPFVTDAFNSSIKQLFEKYEIPARLVNPRGQTLLNLAQERKPSQRPCRSSICPQTVHLPAIVRGLRSNMPALRTLVHWHDQQTITRSHEGAYGFSTEEGRKDSFWRSLRGGASEADTQD